MNKGQKRVKTAIDMVGVFLHPYIQGEVGQMQQLTIVIFRGRADKEVELGQTLDLRVGPVKAGVGESQLDLFGRVVRVKRGVKLQSNKMMFVILGYLF